MTWQMALGVCVGCMDHAIRYSCSRRWQCGRMLDYTLLVPAQSRREAKESRYCTYQPRSWLQFIIKGDWRRSVQPFFLRTNPTGFTAVHPRSNRSHLCHSLIYISSYLPAEYKYLSSARTTLKIIIRISTEINSYHSSSSTESPHKYVKFKFLSRSFSTEDSSKLHEFEV